MEPRVSTSLAVTASLLLYPSFISAYETNTYNVHVFFKSKGLYVYTLIFFIEYKSIPCQYELTIVLLPLVQSSRYQTPFYLYKRYQANDQNKEEKRIQPLKNNFKNVHSYTIQPLYVEY